MFSFINAFSSTRFCWFLLLILGIVFEGCGLYFQYGLHLDPCINCVYERAWILGYIACGIVGFLFANFLITRLIAILGLLASSVGGLLVVVDHLKAYDSANIFGNVCKLKADFPSFFKLDELMPWMFAPSGSCGPVDWSLFGLNMPTWIMVIFICGLLAALLMLVSQFFNKGSRNYSRLYR